MVEQSSFLEICNLNVPYGRDYRHIHERLSGDQKLNQMINSSTNAPTHLLVMIPTNAYDTNIILQQPFSTETLV